MIHNLTLNPKLQTLIHHKVVPCITDPVDLAELERSGDVMYVDDLPHPALFPDWREEDGHRLVSLVGMILRQKEMTMHRFESASVLAVARRNAAEQERRRLQVVVAVVAGLRSSPFYVVLPHAPSRHALDEMCLRALAPTTSRLAMHPNSDVAVEVGRTTVGMRDVARASEVYEADVAMFLLELAFVKTWALRTHGSVPAAREAARGEEEEEEAGAGRGAVAKTGVRADASVAWSSSAAKWMRDATALSRFDRGVRDAIRDCLLR